MKKTDYLILAILQLGIILFVAHYQSIPGNIDADYYFMGGVRLAQGHGFTENYIWNYFNDPVSLPQPSHSYWMPLASILTALGMWVTGNQAFASGRLAFILLAVLITPLTAALAYRITSRRDLAIVSGLLSLFSGFYLPYLPVTENYSIFMVLGALYFYLLPCHSKPRSGEESPLSSWRPFLILGILSGLMALARTDGMIWLALTFLLLAIRYWRDETPLLSKPKLVSLFINLSLTLSGFLLIMLPWYLRNIAAFGSIMSEGTRRAFWLTDYYQTFIYPASQLTFQNWLASGWDAILALRVSAFQRVLYNIVVVQGVIVLIPFILLGAWKLRRSSQVRLGLIVWVLLIFVFTVIFPLAGVRGSYYHAVSALQPLLWALAPVGLDILIRKLQSLKMFQLPKLDLILQATLVFILFFISYASVNALVLTNGWQRGELTYPKVEEFLLQQGIEPEQPVMVINPPGYTMMTERPAVMFPYGGEASILSVAEKFNVHYIVLKNDPVNANAHFNALYNQPDLYRSIQLVGEVDDVRIYKVQVLP
ncbi:MAG: hypothetical protein ABI904_11350 [Chloroflexota bacterium]